MCECKSRALRMEGNALVNKRSGEEKTLLAGKQSAKRRNYFAGGIAPNGAEYEEGHYTDFAWLFILGYDSSTLELVHESGSSMDTSPQGYALNTEPIVVVPTPEPALQLVDVGMSGGGTDLGSPVSGGWDHNPWTSTDSGAAGSSSDGGPSSD